MKYLKSFKEAKKVKLEIEMPHLDIGTNLQLLYDIVDRNIVTIENYFYLPHLKMHSSIAMTDSVTSSTKFQMGYRIIVDQFDQYKIDESDLKELRFLCEHIEKYYSGDYDVLQQTYITNEGYLQFYLCLFYKKVYTNNTGSVINAKDLKSNLISEV